jgi:hypothetical protein
MVFTRKWTDLAKIILRLTLSMACKAPKALVSLKVHGPVTFSPSFEVKNESGFCKQ